MKKLPIWAPLVLILAMGPAELWAGGSEGALPVAASRANPIADPPSSAHQVPERVLERLQARGRVAIGAPLELERSIFFTGADGASKRLDAGTYGVQREGQAIRIRPADGGDGLMLRATLMFHDRPIGGSQSGVLFHSLMPQERANDRGFPPQFHFIPKPEILIEELRCDPAQTPGATGSGCSSATWIAPVSVEFSPAAQAAACRSCSGPCCTNSRIDR